MFQQGILSLLTSCFFRITAIRFDGIWGLRAPHPGGGEFRPRARYFFHVEKVPKKTPGTPRPPYFCLTQSLSDLGHLRTELGFYHLIYSLVVNDASASGPVKGGHVSRGANRSMVLVSQPREFPKEARTTTGPAGDSKGGQASPFVSLRGVVLRRGTQSKVSPS